MILLPSKFQKTQMSKLLPKATSSIACHSCLSFVVPEEAQHKVGIFCINYEIHDNFLRKFQE